MKKLLLIFATFCCFAAQAAVNEIVDVEFTVEIVNNGGLGNPRPKTPVLVPQATLDGNVLTFTTSHADFVLTLLDEDGDEAYTVFVPAATTTVVLPSTLTGLFELQLYPGGSYYFLGDIVL